MGVVKKFAYGRTPPILRSSDESHSSAVLSVPSTPPSEDEDSTRNQRNLTFHPRRRDPALLIERLEHISRKRIGARKTRREDNARALQTLVESNEEDIFPSPTIEDFMPGSKSPLTKLMTDFSCMIVWQYFLAQSEEEQMKYLNDAVERKSRSASARLGVHFTQSPMESTDQAGTLRIPTLSPEQRFSLINSGLRRALKRHNIPLGMLWSLEEDVIEVFHRDSAAVYLSRELNSFERLLLHGICQYHLLKSWSINMAGGRRTKIENKQPSFTYPEITLTDFLEKRIRLLN